MLTIAQNNINNWTQPGENHDGKNDCKRDHNSVF